MKNSQNERRREKSASAESNEDRNENKSLKSFMSQILFFNQFDHSLYSAALNPSQEICAKKKKIVKKEKSAKIKENEK